ATTHYAIGSEDLPNTNRYDVHFFMKVSEDWFKLLGEQLPLDAFTELGQSASPSVVGQSLEHSIPATAMSSNDEKHITTVVKEITEIYPDIFNARLLPVAAETFALLKDLRGDDATFRSRHQAAAIQTIISNPGDSYLAILPTCGGKSDIADIMLLSIESIDTGRFRQQFTELLISKSGKSLIARIIFDEAHTILSHWNFRPSFQAVSDFTSMQVPIVLLSATVPPNKVHQLQRVYNRRDLRVIRAPSTMRANIRYSVERVPDEVLEERLERCIGSFFAHASPKDRALVFCMSVSTTEALYNGFRNKFDGMFYYHGKLDQNAKKTVLDKWVQGEYKLVFCTSGFGVGIDYGSVSNVIHYGGMWELLDFVQESGRAGRDGRPAQSIVLLTPHWAPNSRRLSMDEALAVAEYVQRDGYCRRYV
ncbi:P-loop containing nucleoside triphosphate hydrolase protein, partial [Lipomyces doorenjongii]